MSAPVTDAGDPSLAVRDLVIRYPRSPRPAVDGVDLDAWSGQVTALLGPNGAGKTSTVECCVGLRRASSGSVEVLGDHGVALHTPEHRARVGVMLQDGGLPTGARPLALLRHIASLHADPVDVSALAERLGIPAFERIDIRRLSGGQRQRVALAAALVGRPQLLFLDEPTAGLDPQAAAVVREIVTEQTAAGVAVVLTTHDMNDATDLADHVVVMDQGSVVAAGTVADLTSGGRPSIRLRLPSGYDLTSLTEALPGQVRTEEQRPGDVVLLDVPAGTLTTVSSWLDQTGINPHEVVQRRRTLEDVFLDLTGRHLR